MDSIIIDREDLEFAQELCNIISDEENRSKAVSNIIGARVASKFFDTEKYDVDIETALHNIASINAEFDLSDIYINGSCVGVRVYFTEEEICVPKSHFDSGILPKVYMFIKLSSDLSSGSVTGFALSRNIDYESEKDGYYYIKEEDLVSIYDAEAYFGNSSDTDDVSEYDIYSFIEGSLPNSSKEDLIRKLISSKHSRIAFAKIINAQYVLKQVSDYEFEGESYTQELGAGADTEFTEAEQADSQEDLSSNDFEYKTEVTSINVDSIDNLEQELDYTPEELSYDEEEQQNDEQKEEQIDALFTGEQSGIPTGSKKKSNSFAALIIILFVVCLGGYWIYANVYNQKSDEENALGPAPSIVEEDIQTAAEPQTTNSADEMPNETVNPKTEINANNKEAGNSVSIPAIEQHLDASVLVSNLKVNWDVPSSYTANASVRRYLVKLGKIIQLNLKTELLLLSKPPISNKITVECKYNPSANKFEVVGINESSGEKTVDDTILDTIKAAFNSGLNTNIESVGKLQGNPVLIINL